VAAALACLLPFAGKAFHIDDPLFLWAARQIQSQPGDFYGFEVNWGGHTRPMAEETKNPPLASYYIAAVARVAGWDEAPLHLAFLLPALAVLLGTCELGRRIGAPPLLAALAVLSAPVFLVSATSVMCDTLLLALFVWAIVLWRDGLERDDLARLFAAGALVASASLTKYFGMALLPLLVAYALARKRRPGAWCAALALPVLILLGYQLLTRARYGHGLLFEGAGYSFELQRSLGVTIAWRLLSALAFTGGGLLPLAFLAPRLWRGSLAAVVAAASLAMALLLVPRLAIVNWPKDASLRALVVAHLVVMTLAGLHVLVLIAVECVRRRDHDTLLLALWAFGTFAFAAALNWSVNGRTILPMAPALALLAARRLAARLPSLGWRVGLLLAPSLAVSLAVAWGDARQAECARTSARYLAAKYGRAPGTLWFQGHWGFQYYMETLGASALDAERSAPQPGDHLVLPELNTAVLPVRAENVTLLEVAQCPLLPVVTMHGLLGASFYADLWGGPLPFAFGRVPDDSYSVYLLKRPVR
jgi:4-amino-4-deoxy-L-arabinose transferase-like glycosyltransferase